MVGNGRIAICILLASLAGAAWLSFGYEDEPVTSDTLPHMVGLALGLSALPLLVSLVWNSRNRRRGGTSGAPILAAIVCLALAFGSNLLSVSQQKTLASTPFKYIGPGCDMMVVFPGRPTTTVTQVPGFDLKGEQAELVIEDEGAFLRAECMPITITVELSEELLRGQLEQFAAANGLQNASFTTSHTGESVSGTLYGYKTVSNIPTTYEARMVITPKAIVSVVTGGKSSSYPPPAVAAFHDSLRLMVAP